MYLFGYVIWNAHLSRFGLSTNKLLQFDYISAALCYGFVVLTFALPAALFWHRIYGPNRTTAFPYVTVLFVWLSLLGAYGKLFLTVPAEFEDWNILGVILLVQLILWLLLSLTKKLPKAKAVLSDVVGSILFYGLLITLAGLFNHPNVSRSFMGISLLLYLTAMNFFGSPPHQLLTWNSPALRILIVFGWLAFLLVNVFLFGRSQFGMIPKTVGGGKPERIVLQSHLTNRASLMAFANIPSTNGLIGPALLIYRSDLEFCLMSESNYTNGRGRAVQLRKELVDEVVYLHTNAMIVP